MLEERAEPCWRHVGQAGERRRGDLARAETRVHVHTSGYSGHGTSSRSRDAIARCAGAIAATPSRSARVCATRRIRAPPRPVSWRTSHSARHASWAAASRGAKRCRAPAGTCALRRQGVPRKACSLPRDCGDDPCPHLARGFAARVVGSRGPHGKPEVEPVEKRCGQAPPVPRPFAVPASALRRAEPARARVGAHDEEEVGREAQRDRLTGDPHGALLERLTERVERARRELAELVEEEHATVRHRRLAGARRPAAATDQCRDRRGVVGRTERRHSHERAGQAARDRVDPGDLERLVGAQIREHRDQATRQHRLADARWPAEQEVVATCRGGLERTAGPREAAHLREVERVVVVLVGLRIGRRRNRRPRLLPLETRPQLLETPRGVHHDVRHQRRLGRVLRRHHERTSPGAGKCGDERQRAGNRSNPAVEPELAEHRDVFERGVGKHVGGDEHPEGDGDMGICSK